MVAWMPPMALLDAERSRYPADEPIGRQELIQDFAGDH